MNGGKIGLSPVNSIFKVGYMLKGNVKLYIRAPLVNNDRILRQSYCYKPFTMKQLLYSLMLFALLSSCKASKNYLERSDADKALQDAVKKINKDASDEKALEAIPLLYSKIKQNNLEKINSYQQSKDLSKWDKIIGSYQNLQDAYEAIVNSPAAFKLVTPQSFSTNLLEAKDTAASEYYDYAQTQLAKPGRDNARKAYNAFKKSDKFVGGFKDAKEKMNEALDIATVNVLINPVEDNSFFFNSGWGNYGYNYSNEYFQQTLVRELSSGSSTRYPAKFYTEWEARRDNIKPDWVVDLRLRNLDVPYPITYNYSRNASARVQVGTDTSGNAVYNTVYATLQITRMSFTARADMELNIKDLSTRKNITYRNFREEYAWQQEKATYSGDSRALSSRDWQLINNNYITPRKEEVLNELYRKIYPQVLNNIRYAVEW